MTDLRSFELINIFKAMISIVKVELINATENYLLNIFFVRNIFPTICPILIWLRSRVIDIIWTKMLYNILSNERELKVVYQQSFPVEKK